MLKNLYILQIAGKSLRDVVTVTANNTLKIILKENDMFAQSVGRVSHDPGL
jgi:hypothetical protein